MELFTDEHIISRINNDGDHEAFRHLIDKHKDFVYSLSLKIAHNKNDAEEITQDTFLKAFKQLKTFKGKSKFTTWLYRITYFTALNHIRKQRVKTRAIEEWEHPQSDSSPAALVHSEDREKAIDLALTHLKPQERAIITLFYLDECSIEEIAAITKLSVSNTKVKIHRTRKKLKNIISKQLKGEELDLIYN